MAGGNSNMNSKKAAGMAKKADNAAKKQATKDKAAEEAAKAEWTVGSDAKRVERDQAEAARRDEAARKKREKEELLAQEEAALGSGGKVKVATPVGGAKNAKAGGKSKKNDLALLEDALQKDADRKVRKKKQEELQRKQEQENAQRNAEASKPVLDPLLANTESMIGPLHDDDMDKSNNRNKSSSSTSGGVSAPVVGREANRATMEEGEINATGIDAALASFSISRPGGGSGIGSVSGGSSSLGLGGGQVKSAKALYNEFETMMLPQVRAEHPGLRLSQYKERIWELWKKSPDNPANQMMAVATALKGGGGR